MHQLSHGCEYNISNIFRFSHILPTYSKDPWWYPNTRCLMVIKVGYSQSEWRRSCSYRRQFKQIGSFEGSGRWRYCLREGWWSDCRRARRTSSFLLFICFASRETLRRWYIESIRSCVGGVSQNVSLITWMELDREVGRILFVAMQVVFFGCFVGHIVTWNGIIDKDPLNEDGRRYGVDGIVDWKCSRIGWDESFTQGLTIYAKE